MEPGREEHSKLHPGVNPVAIVDIIVSYFNLTMHIFIAHFVLYTNAYSYNKDFIQQTTNIKRLLNKCRDNTYIM